MKSLQRLTLLTTLLTLICSFIFCNSVYAFDNPNLLPNYSTPVLDLAKSFNPNQIERLESSINEYEANTGWKIRVLTQFENTPGKAIKEYWDLDERTLLLVADPRGGNLLNFNVGDAYFTLMPRTFWVELQTRFGNQFYVRDNGEDLAIIGAVKSVEFCLDKGGCQKVPGLPKEQWLWTLAASILGGFIAGIAGSPRNEDQLIAWKWLLLVSPIWIIPFGVIGIAQVVTRTSEFLPLLRNILAFMTSAIAAYIFAKSTLSKSETGVKKNKSNE
ncbi:hypothetical protein [Prochlorococcus marinus]|uniref:TPM domain-containing protein n=1 Tax=Prochlorococcus marinus (strain MIT 9211) TaxID=93059 RepID=A9BA64_PROM4|nr:hypothetical protein [Prochlorococcus marinus]ABX08726.1 conserved hypothetical protein [Prochlorococcus marinus str. MIT 9211]